jgi:hypothetical protein
MLWSNSFLGDASMTFRDGRQLVFPALVFVAVAAGCSSKPATARAFVNAALRSGTSSTGACNFSASQPIVQVGTWDKTAALSDTNPTRVNDGTIQGGSVSLDCSVRPTGSTFSIGLSAQVMNTQVGGGGAMTIAGSNIDPSTGGSNVQGTFAFGGVQYTDSNCTISYTFNGGQISLANNAPKIAPGRIWAHIDCPNASAQGPSGQNLVCDANADFVFENCGS